MVLYTSLAKCILNVKMILFKERFISITSCNLCGKLQFHERTVVYLVNHATGFMEEKK